MSKYKRTKQNIRTSKLELKFESMFLKPLRINYIHQYEHKYKFYDFFLPEHGILIEVDGDFWHGNKKTNKKLSKMQKRNQMNDSKKNRKAELSGYKLLRFWESDIHNRPDIVIRKLKKAISNNIKKL